MGRRSGVFGGMGVRVGSELIHPEVLFVRWKGWEEILTMCVSRSPEQVSQRMDELIKKIREIQRPCMNGQKPADVVVVSSRVVEVCVGKSNHDVQVAHGMSLRCFVKRWIGLPLDANFPQMLSPGAIGILR